MTLFDNNPARDEAIDKSRPLADRMRPRTLDEFVGQEHILGPGKSLRVQIERDDTGSLIFWGPPGVGKTTLAKIIARMTHADFIEFSAVLAGIKEIKQVMADAERARQYGTRTIVFVDEVHRFNKAQQDAFLPYVEKGSIRLIGATTENPSFEVISALLSRSRVYVLQSLSEEQIVGLLQRALADEERGLGDLHLTAEESALRKIAAYSSGDARSAYNALEVAATLAQEAQSGVTDAIVTDALQKRVLRYDKGGEEHYNLISALHKSVRNSDPDAALYWLGRMLEAGEDRLYVARRVVRMAVEDIGLADPNALGITLAARDAFDFLGMPEGDLALAQAVVYLCAAPKSNARLHGVRSGERRCRADRAGSGAAASAQRADWTYEGPRVWPGLPVCAQPGVEGRGHAVPTRQLERSRVLPSDRRGNREAHQSAAGRDSKS